MGQFFKLSFLIPSHQAMVIAKCVLTVHRFRKAPRNFQRDVIPGASLPYEYIDIHLYLEKCFFLQEINFYFHFPVFSI